MTDPVEQLKTLIRRADHSKSGVTVVSKQTLFDIAQYIRYLQTQRKNLEPHWTRKHFFSQCEAEWPPGDIRPNLARVIARYNGWAPLEPGKVISVHFGEERYEIKRIK